MFKNIKENMLLMNEQIGNRSREIGTIFFFFERAGNVYLHYILSRICIYTHNPVPSWENFLNKNKTRHNEYDSWVA